MHVPTHFLYYIPLQKLFELALRFVAVEGRILGEQGKFYVALHLCLQINPPHCPRM
jgi:hypothetical protein